MRQERRFLEWLTLVCTGVLLWIGAMASGVCALQISAPAPPGHKD